MEKQEAGRDGVLVVPALGKWVHLRKGRLSYLLGSKPGRDPASNTKIGVVWEMTVKLSSGHVNIQEGDYGKSREGN